MPKLSGRLRKPECCSASAAMLPPSPLGGGHLQASSEAPLPQFLAWVPSQTLSRHDNNVYNWLSTHHRHPPCDLTKSPPQLSWKMLS